MENMKRFGVDAPVVPLFYLLAGLGLLIHAYVNRQSYSIVGEVVLGIVLILGAGLFFHTTLRGKYRIFDQVVQRLALAPDAQVLDLGCGRGALLTRIAQQFTVPGKVTGLDLWRSRDQSHNGLAVAQKNLDYLGVADRATLVTGNMVKLSFADNSFDAVTTSFALHNISSFKQRDQAVQEAIRVLKPGGQLLIIDTGHHATQYRDGLRAGHVEIVTSRGLGINGWWSGPWMGSYLIFGKKQG